MYYYLMRKNDVVTTVELNDMGQLVWADYQNVKEPKNFRWNLQLPQIDSVCGGNIVRSIKRGK